MDLLSGRLTHKKEERAGLEQALIRESWETWKFSFAKRCEIC
jgi:hypothetical protein